MPGDRPSDWLAQFRRTVTSQNGEDGVIEKAFEIIGSENKWCVEFGAGSGKKSNNTWNLIRHHHWRAVLIEGDRALYQKLVKNYIDLPGIYCLRAYVSAQGRYSLDTVLSQTPVPRDFDFLSIDIDGDDYHVWQALRGFRPRTVMIEFNHGIPIDIDFIQPKNHLLKAGSSLAAINKLAKQKGYELVYAYACNALFVRQEFFNRFGIIDNAPARVLSKPYPSARWFQLSDGSIVLLDLERKRLLSARKKILSSPVWILAEGQLYPVKFRRDWRFIRTIKNIIKHTPLYPLFYPLVMKVYGLLEEQRKRRL